MIKCVHVCFVLDFVWDSNLNGVSSRGGCFMFDKELLGKMLYACFLVVCLLELNICIRIFLLDVLNRPLNYFHFISFISFGIALCSSLNISEFILRWIFSFKIKFLMHCCKPVCEKSSYDLFRLSSLHDYANEEKIQKIQRKLFRREINVLLSF